jgi:hypothetical protein
VHAAALLSTQPLSESITSLHDAAKWGDLEAAERLLNEGADVNGVVRLRAGGGGLLTYMGVLVCWGERRGEWSALRKQQGWGRSGGQKAHCWNATGCWNAYFRLSREAGTLGQSFT